MGDVRIQQTLHINGGQMVWTVGDPTILGAVIDLMHSLPKDHQPRDVAVAAGAVAGELVSGAVTAAYGDAEYTVAAPPQVQARPDRTVNPAHAARRATAANLGLNGGTPAEAAQRRAAEIVYVYGAMQGAQGDDVGTVLADLLADVMLLVDSHGLELSDLLVRADRYAYQMNRDSLPVPPSEPKTTTP